MRFCTPRVSTLLKKRWLLLPKAAECVREVKRPSLTFCNYGLQGNWTEIFLLFSCSWKLSLSPPVYQVRVAAFV